MKIFWFVVTVMIIIFSAPIIDWMMEEGGPVDRSLGLLLVFSLAGVFNVINRLADAPKSNK